MPKPWKKSRAGARERPSLPRTLHTEHVADELDLHGLGAHAAQRRLEMFLERAALSAPGEVVRVLTGRLAHRVEEWAVDVGGGAYLVRVKR